MKNIGIIGGGLIGSSWAEIFSKSGFDVFVYDWRTIGDGQALGKYKAKILPQELKFINLSIISD